jgi:hypothetical protein
MDMKRIGRVFFFAGLAIALAGAGEAAAGLRTQVGEAVIENLQIGQEYSLKELANLDLIVMNTGEEEVDLRMDVLIPEPVELKLNAEAVPDISWATLTPSDFTLGPSGQAEAEIRLAIPYEPAYLGRTFQFTIWSHTIPRGGGMALAYGLKTRIIFTIATEIPDDAPAATTAAASVDFALQPEDIHVDGVTPGVEFNMATDGGRVLKITNRGDEPQTLNLKSRKVLGSLATLTPGYEDAPDASFLRFSEDKVIVGPGETRTVKLFLDFPAGPKYSGHRYMFVIHGTTTGGRVTTGVYSRVYAAVE